MRLLLCGCVWEGTPCTRAASQEDLLCDPCRANAVEPRNVLVIFNGNGEHHHYNMGGLVLSHLR